MIQYPGICGSRLPLPVGNPATAQQPARRAIVNVELQRCIKGIWSRARIRVSSIVARLRRREAGRDPWFRGGPRSWIRGMLLLSSWRIKNWRLWAYPRNKGWEPSVIMYWTYIICIRRTTNKPMEPRSVMSLRQKDAPQTKGKRRLEVNTQRLLNPWCDTVLMLIFNSQHLNVNGLVRNDGKSWFLSKIYCKLR